MHFEPRNTHHRLPRSRGGLYKDRKKDAHNKIEINEPRHRLWHTLMHNKIAKEVAAQLTIWWQKGHIFQMHASGKFECKHFAPGTRGTWFRWKIKNVSLEMTKNQVEAWDSLFGRNTTPDIVIEVVNKFFVHPDSPIDLIRAQLRHR